MIKCLVKVYNWDGLQLCLSENQLEVKDQVVLRREESQNELGVVESVEIKTKDRPDWAVVRKADDNDLEVFRKNEEKKKEVLDTCKDEARRLNLEMKVVDARISLDGSNVVIAFTAEERVDFRELVRNLSKIFRRSVRMHQIGSRDEARNLGGAGICGRKLCCLHSSGNLPSISIDMARVQQIAHRGSERISGICGRLMCCLSYEAKQYEEMMKGMPQPHSQVKTPEGKGSVVEINPLTSQIKVKLEDGKYVTFKKEEIK